MAAGLSPRERALQAELATHPFEHEACAGCIFYAPRFDADGYCAHPEVKLDVGANWWCKYYDRNEAKAKLAGHPLHPALIPFPLALTGMAFIFDIMAGPRRRSQWRSNAKHALIAGMVGGILAAPAGMMDWASLPPDRPAKMYGLVHGLGNLLLLAINGVNIGLRSGRREPSLSRRAAEVGLSILAGTLGVITGWIGGQLTYREAIGVQPPTQPYRALEFEPVARLTEEVMWKDGSLKVPEEPIWKGPTIPSQPLPQEVEQRLEAGPLPGLRHEEHPPQPEASI